MSVLEKTASNFQEYFCKPQWFLKYLVTVPKKWKIFRIFFAVLKKFV